MTAAPQTPDLDALKAILVDALKDATFFGSCGYRETEYDSGTITFGNKGVSEYALTALGADKLAATIHSKVAAPLLVRIAELEASAELPPFEVVQYLTARGVPRYVAVGPDAPAIYDRMVKFQAVEFERLTKGGDE